MCMMIYHPASAEPFTGEELDDFARRNPHGFGAIWRTPSGAIRSRRGMLNRDQIWQLYRSLMAQGCKEMALHWRFRTAGAIGDANCHPFPVGDGALLMHNGARLGPSTATKSDTECFAENVLTPMLRRWPAAIHDKKWVRRMEARIGGGNKLLIWRAEDPSPVVVGDGVWHRGRWYSNTYAWASAAALPRRSTPFVWTRIAPRSSLSEWLKEFDA